MVQQPAGYSGNPLVKKLGIKAGMSVAVVNAPDGFFEDVLGPMPEGSSRVEWPASSPLALIHYFCTQQFRLIEDLEALQRSLLTDGALWISWPKKTSKMPTDIDENTLRTLILPTGWVDVKVCAVDERWSGLKFVLRKALR